jgi:RNA polymerase sigma-70 factor (ECF subfamily)
MPAPANPSSPDGNRLFHTTHWSVVLAAGGGESEPAMAALEQLCRAYWPAVYAYARRCGHGPHDAEDLAQEFFHRLLDRHYLAQADPRRGRFRNFLLVAVKHFLANEWDRAKAVKRGGRLTFISLEQWAGAAETWEAAGQETPDQAFARTWALTFLDRVLACLREELGRDEQRAQFDELKAFLLASPSALPYAEVAARLGTTEAAIKMAVQRLRRRFAQVLREEIAHTVAGPEEIDDEIRTLFAAVSR